MTEPADKSTSMALDTLLPAAIAREAEILGERKARLDRPSLFALAVLAGAFIGLGVLFSNVAGVGAEALPFGLGRIVVGVSFSLGLVLVVLGGAELFTGNGLMVMALAAGRIKPRDLIIAWSIVYLGNLVGAVGTALLAFLAGQHDFGGEVGRLAVGIAATKAELPFAMLIDADTGGTSVTLVGVIANLVPVTIGNILGGAGLVGLVYWFIYLRPGRPNP